MKKNVFSIYALSFGTILLSILGSCSNPKKLAYFNNIVKDSTAKIQANFFETKISKNDVLQISFFTPDDITTRLLNEPSNSSGGVSGSVPGYLVDETGIIKLPFIGALPAEGLTKRELAAKITSELLNKKIAIDPIVTVRIINYKITVLGEVNHPGVVPVPNERITLPEAIGDAGDLTIFGRRDNVLLIRENGDKRIYKRFNLNNQELFNKEIYNLQNQDIIYVEPNQARASSANNSTQLVTIGISVVSLLIVIYTNLLR